MRVENRKSAENETGSNPLKTSPPDRSTATLASGWIEDVMLVVPARVPGCLWLPLEAFSRETLLDSGAEVDMLERANEWSEQI